MTAPEIRPGIPALLSLDEVADYTGLPAETFTLLAALGIGPRSLRVGQRVVYPTADVDTWRSDRNGWAAELKAGMLRVIDALAGIDQEFL